MSANPARAAEPRPPANEAEMRAALAWDTGRKAPDEKNTWAWLWEAIQGDFNGNRSTGQIAFDAGISFIPVVDQICDVRDIIANCRSIAQSNEKDDNTWKWVALVLTLIGLFPSIGSLVKGVLKIFFVFVRRYGGDKIVKAVDDAMTWVITFLRKREVQQYLRHLKVDEVFKWLATQIKSVRGIVTQQALLAAFDKAIGVMKGLLEKVTWLPSVGQKAQAAIDQVQSVRRLADKHIGAALKPVQDVLDTIIRRLEIEHLMERSGVLNVHNIHFRGTLPEAQAVRLMRTADPLPAWLIKGRVGSFAPLDATNANLKRMVATQVANGWPDINKNINTFHRLRADEMVGPAKLYRIGSPGSQAMGDCWVSEEVFHKLISAPDPKTAWRKHLAVWPDWNANGQFEVFTLARDEKLKVWRGAAASQTKDPLMKLDAHLEGGWEQVIFKAHAGQSDTTRFYRRGGKDGHRLQRAISQQEYVKLSRAQKAEYTAVREKINHPAIEGPFDTNWGFTDFDPQLSNAKIGLPSLPGQVTNRTP